MNWIDVTISKGFKMDWTRLINEILATPNEPDWSYRTIAKTVGCTYNNIYLLRKGDSHSCGWELGQSLIKLHKQVVK